MAGILYGVGVGPGDPELMTLKAVRILRECGTIGIPAETADSCTAYQVAVKAVPEIEGKPVLAVPVPMTKDRKKLSCVYDEGCRRLMEELEKGGNIAFLNLGDPSVYGTYMEFHSRILKAGYQAEVINGVPSFCAVAAALDIALGARKEQIHILPGNYGAGEWEQYSGTRILMKSGGRIGEVKEQLLQLERDGKIEAYAVTNCGMERQKIFHDIGELGEDAGYFTTIVVKDKDN
ncbi:MAG: precorrin-2 C(20)-methyltransferase [Lachnospiraceae bacterium]|nr:precorrin-2 C(20)-methyltransferase [Lachnospiraceae bacterium]